MGQEYRAWVQALVIALYIELIVVVSVTFCRECPSDNVRVLNDNESKVGALLLPKVIYCRDIHYQIDSPVKAHSDRLSLASRNTHLEFDIWGDLQ